MLQREHSAILLTFIKLPFVIKTYVLSMFEWPNILKPHFHFKKAPRSSWIGGDTIQYDDITNVTMTSDQQGFLYHPMGLLSFSKQDKLTQADFYKILFWKTHQGVETVWIQI